MQKYFKSQLLKWKKEVKVIFYGLETQMEDVDAGLAAIFFLQCLLVEVMPLNFNVSLMNIVLMI